MKNRVIVSIISFIVVLVASNGKIMNAFLNLALVGLIPGTSYSIPYWAMMAIYCTVIAILVTYWVENAFELHRRDKQARMKSRPARRHYSHS